MADPSEVVVASGPIGKPLRQVVDQLAANSAWQTWTGAADTDAAYGFIWHPNLEEPLKHPWPLAVVQPGNLRWTKVDTNHLRPSGEVVVTFLSRDAHPDRRDWGELVHSNNVGAVLAVLAQQLTDSGATLNTQGIENRQPVTYSRHPKEGAKERFWSSKWAILWGSQ